MGGFDNIILELTIIFAGSALLASIFLFLKQPIILAYIALGFLIGPGGLRILKEADHIKEISHLGIILLMYLLGLHLHPQKLGKLIGRTVLITVSTCLLFAGLFMTVAVLFGFELSESIIIGLALMFSSTVVSLKLVPTTTLHQQRIGEIMTSILLMQDIIAISVLLFLFASLETSVSKTTLLLLGKTTVFTGLAVILVYGILLKLFRKFDVIQDYIFLVSVGWCLLCAEVAHLLGLSYEIGAFIAGVCLGSSPIALVIAEGLKPLREFFLILFFFSIGAQFDFLVTTRVILPGLILVVLIILLKPVLFYPAFRLARENKLQSKELGLRLGQASEFSILIAYSALTAGKISENASYLIQLTAILTFIVSTYLVVFKYQTPIAISTRLRKD